MMTPDSPKMVTTMFGVSVNTGPSGVIKCPICLVEYEEWEVLRQLPFCGHIFHTLCVGAWFEKQTTCPVCRMSMSELTDSFGIEDNNNILYRGPRSSDAAVEMVPETTPSWIMINRRLPLPAPPIPEFPTESTTAHTVCTCSSGHGNITETTQPKTSGGCERVDALQRRGTAAGSTDFHVVNIQQLSHTCKCTAKPAKSTVTSDDISLYSTAIPDVQILIFQTSVLARTDEGSDINPTRLNCELGVSNNPQELTSGSNYELAATQPMLEAAEGAVSRCEDSPSSGEALEGPEDVQPVSPQGSFEFQPILSESGELSFRATTL